VLEPAVRPPLVLGAKRAITLPARLKSASSPRLNRTMRSILSRTARSPSPRESDEPEFISVKCRDPDGYIVDVPWELERLERGQSERSRVSSLSTQDWSAARAAIGGPGAARASG
jgi:hypothetical protein